MQESSIIGILIALTGITWTKSNVIGINTHNFHMPAVQITVLYINRRTILITNYCVSAMSNTQTIMKQTWVQLRGRICMSISVIGL